MTRTFLHCILAVGVVSPLGAQTFHLSTHSALDAPSSVSSSSTSFIPAESPSEGIAPVPVAAPRKTPYEQLPTLTTSVTSFGPGLDYSLPISQSVGLRAGFHAMTFSHQFESNGVPFTANIDSKTAALQFDISPFHGNFRISPGVLALNSINVVANATVAGGAKFDMGNGTYTSSAQDPIKAKATMMFGYNLSPMVTMGFRSILPHRWNLVMPVDLGAVYNFGPRFKLDVSGSACDDQNNCGKISMNPSGANDVTREQTNWANTLSKYSFLPVVSVGLGYRFGGTGHSR